MPESTHNTSTWELETSRRRLLVAFGSVLAASGLETPMVARAAVLQAADPFEQLKQALDRSGFKLLMDMLIEANNAEIAALASDSGQAARTRTTLLQNLNRDLRAARDTAGTQQTFDLAKRLADVALAKFNVISLGASLVASAFANPFSRVKVVIAALKVLAKVEALKDKAADLSAIAAELERLSSQLEHASPEQRTELEKKIKEQLEKARDLLNKP